MIDWQGLLYDPVYDVLGVEAVLTLPGTDGVELTLTVLDKTRPTTLGRDRRGAAFGVEVDTVEPSAMVRVSDLTGHGPQDLHEATLSMNGKTWLVRSHLMEPAPTGEAAGEIRLLLEEI